jgi:hypothetical protein
VPEIPDQHGELTDRTPVLQAIVGELAKKLTALQDDAAARFALVMNEWAAESDRAKTAAIESAYRAGREDAARDLERVARSTRESLVSTPPEYAGEAARHRTRAEAFERSVVVARGADQPRTLHSSSEVQDNPEAQQCPARFSCESCRCVLDAGHDGDHDQHCQGRPTQ